MAASLSEMIRDARFLIDTVPSSIARVSTPPPPLPDGFTVEATPSPGPCGLTAEYSLSRSSTAPVSSKASPISFLGLPAEIRVIVYKMVYAQIGCSENYCMRGCTDYSDHPGLSWLKCPQHWHTDDQDCRCLPRSEIGLLLASKDIYKEAKAVFDMAPIVYESQFTFSRRIFSAAICSRIQVVVIKGTSIDQLPQVQHYYSAACPNLGHIRSLWVVFSKDSLGPPKLAKYVRKRLQTNSALKAVDQNDLLEGLFMTSDSRRWARKSTRKLPFTVLVPYSFWFEVKKAIKTRRGGFRSGQTVFAEMCNTMLVWDKTGFRLEGLPDFTKEEWWRVWHERSTFKAHPVRNELKVSNAQRYKVMIQD